MRHQALVQARKSRRAALHAASLRTPRCELVRHIRRPKDPRALSRLARPPSQPRRAERRPHFRIRMPHDMQAGAGLGLQERDEAVMNKVKVPILHAREWFAQGFTEARRRRSSPPSKIEQNLYQPLNLNR